ncbi:MAG TPA: hypothetical protein VFO40_15685 [Chthoniobacterales bacterium]|nr:hypothetical protein [Chthoniobacterales bacterium]
MVPVMPVVVQIVEDAEELSREELSNILAEIDARHWKAVRQILIEAKYKAEHQLRNEAIIKDPQLSAHYQGWVNYADYALANFEGLRAGEIFAGTPYQQLSEELR